MTYNFDSIPYSFIREGHKHGTCSQCGEVADVENLRRNYLRAGGHELWCDDCHAALPREVVRFSQSGGSRVVHKNLSLADAQAICSDPSTKGEGWFYGFRIQGA